MTTGAIDALHADREAMLKIGTGLTDAEWATASGCPGWSVKDVLAHLGTLLRLVIDPASLPDATGLDTERAQDLYVASRRSWTPARVLADYEWVSLPAFEALEGLAGLDLEVPLGDFGSYPASLISSDAPAFIRWVTQRGSWAELGVQGRGDDGALRVASGLKVF